MGDDAPLPAPVDEEPASAATAPSATDAKSSSSSTSSSGEESSASECEVDSAVFSGWHRDSILWVLPLAGRGLIHLHRQESADRPVAWCKSKAFRGRCETGEGVGSVPLELGARGWCPECSALVADEVDTAQILAPITPA